MLLPPLKTPCELCKGLLRHTPVCSKSPHMLNERIKGLMEDLNFAIALSPLSESQRSTRVAVILDDILAIAYTYDSSDRGSPFPTWTLAQNVAELNAIVRSLEDRIQELQTANNFYVKRYRDELAKGKTENESTSSVETSRPSGA
jgi:transposase